MEKFNWKALQNGSDIRGIAIEGVPGEVVNLDERRMEILGCAFYHWMEQGGGEVKSVALGMDSRLSGPVLKDCFARGFSAMGGNVYDCGLASTPAMFMATRYEEMRAGAGVMLTASHLPFNRNGLKFFTREGGLNKKDISEILEIAANLEQESALSSAINSVPSGRIVKKDLLSLYAADLVSRLREAVNHPVNRQHPLDGLKIIVDAGNGAGGFFAEKVLRPLGADTSGSQFLDPDGMFPNHIPNPEDEEAMQSVCKAVSAHAADLGIIFDTDVDRAAVVDKNGRPVNRNALIALISAIILEDHPGTTVVTDSISSEGLTRFIGELGGKHHRFKRGYKNVINEAIRLNAAGEDCQIAIETSGHAALKENYFLDDGAFLVLRILVKVAVLRMENQAIGSLISGLEHPAESVEYRLKIKNGDFKAYGEKVITEMARLIEGQKGWEPEKHNFEGIRVKCRGEDENGWFLLRLSLHDPVMPLNIESELAGGCAAIKSKLPHLLSVYKDLDLEPLV